MLSLWGRCAWITNHWTTFKIHLETFRQYECGCAYCVRCTSGWRYIIDDKILQSENSTSSELCVVSFWMDYRVQCRSIQIEFEASIQRCGNYWIPFQRLGFGLVWTTHSSQRLFQFYQSKNMNHSDEIARHNAMHCISFWLIVIFGSKKFKNFHLLRTHCRIFPSKMIIILFKFCWIA